MKTIGEFLEIVEFHKNLPWFIDNSTKIKGWSEILLVGFYGFHFVPTIAALNNPIHTDKVIWEVSAVEDLCISLSLNRALAVASTFTCNRICTFKSLKSFEKIVILRRKLLEILKPF